MFHRFHYMLQMNTSYVLLVKILHLEKKEVISTLLCLEFTFPGEDVIDEKDDAWAGRNFIVK